MNLIKSGGLTMIPLLICSLIVWAIIFERIWRFWNLKNGLKQFQLEAMNALLRSEIQELRALCQKETKIPTARVVLSGLDRLNAKDEKLRKSWKEALERQRQSLTQELRQNLWILGSIGSAAPFIGLLGTVIGILGSFSEMAKTGSGGFTVVASGISESLIATAAGLVVGIVAVLAYNAFQNWLSGLLLSIRLYTEELAEVMSKVVDQS